MLIADSVLVHAFKEAVDTILENLAMGCSRQMKILGIFLLNGLRLPSIIHNSKTELAQVDVLGSSS